MLKQRLFWKLYPSYVLIVFLSLAAIGWYTSKTLKSFYLDITASDLKARAILLHDQVLPFMLGQDYKNIDIFCKNAGRNSSTRITVILPSGKVIGDSGENPVNMENHGDRPEIMAAFKGMTGTSTRYSPTLDLQMMYVAIPVRSAGNLIGVMRTAIPVTAIAAPLRLMYLQIFMDGVLIVLLAGLISFFVARRISQPLETIKTGAEEFAKGNFQTRLSPTGTEEITSVANTLNLMATQINERIDMITRQKNERDAILSSMIEGVIAVDTKEKVISINQAAARMFGVQPDKIIGNSIQESIRNITLHKLITKTLASSKPVESELVLHEPYERLIQAQGTILRDTEQRVNGAVIVLHDITRLRQLEKVRKDFVANVSHELKTPITSIKGYVENLLDGAADTPENRTGFLKTILRHADRLDAIIQDLLLLAKLDQDPEKLMLDREESSLKSTLQSAINICSVEANEKSIAVILNCPEDLILSINPQLLEQAIINLLNNAVKYSDPDSNVTIDVTILEPEVVVAVCDQGCGIAQEHIPRLFERFYTVDKARSQNLGGTGLGLAIVKHIVLAHGGNITVTSTPGKGSTFSIHLPRS